MSIVLTVKYTTKSMLLDASEEKGKACTPKIESHFEREESGMPTIRIKSTPYSGNRNVSDVTIFSGTKDDSDYSGPPDTSVRFYEVPIIDSREKWFNPENLAERRTKSVPESGMTCPEIDDINIETSSMNEYPKLASTFDDGSTPLNLPELTLNFQEPIDTKPNEPKTDYRWRNHWLYSSSPDVEYVYKYDSIEYDIDPKQTSPDQFSEAQVEPDKIFTENSNQDLISPDFNVYFQDYSTVNTNQEMKPDPSFEPGVNLDSAGTQNGWDDSWMCSKKGYDLDFQGDASFRHEDKKVTAYLYEPFKETKSMGTMSDENIPFIDEDQKVTAYMDDQSEITEPIYDAYIPFIDEDSKVTAYLKEPFVGLPSRMGSNFDVNVPFIDEDRKVTAYMDEPFEKLTNIVAPNFEVNIPFIDEDRKVTAYMDEPFEKLTNIVGPNFAVNIPINDEDWRVTAYEPFEGTAGMEIMGRSYDVNAPFIDRGSKVTADMHGQFGRTVKGHSYDAYIPFIDEDRKVTAYLDEQFERNVGVSVMRPDAVTKVTACLDDPFERHVDVRIVGPDEDVTVSAYLDEPFKKTYYGENIPRTEEYQKAPTYLNEPLREFEDASAKWPIFSKNSYKTVKKPEETEYYFNSPEFAYPQYDSNFENDDSTASKKRISPKLPTNQLSFMETMSPLNAGIPEDFTGQRSSQSKPGTVFPSYFGCNDPKTPAETSRFDTAFRNQNKARNSKVKPDTSDPVLASRDSDYGNAKKEVLISSGATGAAIYGKEHDCLDKTLCKHKTRKNTEPVKCITDIPESFAHDDFRSDEFLLSKAKNKMFSEQNREPSGNAHDQFFSVAPTKSTIRRNLNSEDRVSASSVFEDEKEFDSSSFESLNSDESFNYGTAGIIESNDGDRPSYLSERNSFFGPRSGSALDFLNEEHLLRDVFDIPKIENYRHKDALKIDEKHIAESSDSLTYEMTSKSRLYGDEPSYRTENIGLSRKPPFNTNSESLLKFPNENGFESTPNEAFKVPNTQSSSNKDNRKMGGVCCRISKTGENVEGIATSAEFSNLKTLNENNGKSKQNAVDFSGKTTPADENLNRLQRVARVKKDEPKQHESAQNFENKNFENRNFENKTAKRGSESEKDGAMTFPETGIGNKVKSLMKGIDLKNIDMAEIFRIAKRRFSATADQHSAVVGNLNDFEEEEKLKRVSSRITSAQTEPTLEGLNFSNGNVVDSTGSENSPYSLSNYSRSSGQKIQSAELANPNFGGILEALNSKNSSNESKNCVKKIQSSLDQTAKPENFNSNDVVRQTDSENSENDLQISEKKFHSTLDQTEPPIISHYKILNSRNNTITDSKIDSPSNSSSKVSKKSVKSLHNDTTEAVGLPENISETTSPSNLQNLPYSPRNIQNTPYAPIIVHNMPFFPRNIQNMPYVPLNSRSGTAGLNEFSSPNPIAGISESIGSGFKPTNVQNLPYAPSIAQMKTSQTSDSAEPLDKTDLNFPAVFSTKSQSNATKKKQDKGITLTTEPICAGLPGGDLGEFHNFDDSSLFIQNLPYSATVIQEASSLIHPDAGQFTQNVPFSPTVIQERKLGAELDVSPPGGALVSQDDFDAGVYPDLLVSSKFNSENSNFEGLKFMTENVFSALKKGMKVVDRNSPEFVAFDEKNSPVKKSTELAENSFRVESEDADSGAFTKTNSQLLVLENQPDGVHQPQPMIQFLYQVFNVGTCST